jgi:hypothetical protein
LQGRVVHGVTLTELVAPLIGGDAYAAGSLSC